VNFPSHRHFVHDVGAFQLGIGVTLLLAMIWVAPQKESGRLSNPPERRPRRCR